MCSSLQGNTFPNNYYLCIALPWKAKNKRKLTIFLHHAVTFHPKRKIFCSRMFWTNLFFISCKQKVISSNLLEFPAMVINPRNVEIPALIPILVTTNMRFFLVGY